MSSAERPDPGTADPADPADPGDRTGRARIRDAALAQFAEHGVAGATLREIARSAGVTAGLVRHHFGSKEGLREACDAYVVAYIRRETARVLDEGGIGDADVLSGVFTAAPGLMAYVARSLTDGGPAGEALFDAMVATTEAYLARQPARSDAADLHARAAVLTAMKLGVTVLSGHLHRSLGLSPEDALPLVARASLDLFAPHVMGEDLAERARLGLAAYEHDHHSQEGTTR